MEKKYILEGKKNPKKRLATECTCSYCGKTFLRANHLIEKNQTVFYCSIECKNKARETKVDLVCEYCGKQFKRRPSALANSRSGHVFCSKKCKDNAQKIYDNENASKFSDMVPPHYGTATDYRLLALLNKPAKCERCGYDANPLALDVHHKDRNRNNNSIDNLEILCANCHAIEHRSKH